ncbi:hypothetical protein KUCAC02_009752 [Chaenocephalus aceratus]|uniref:Uncharacterized protein n=1 Tax=Chaenocephalus aceratus TaxID=36190 RepID=A0ACB9VXG4_CHAAC|nr:hypothetical protein KUCAC02_009752 [Chaenocephalus aceratus]
MARTASRNVGKYTSTHKSRKRNIHRPRPTRTIVTRSQCLTVGCFFHRLPSEVYHMILDKMSVLEISIFSMVSKEITRSVVEYISTLAWKIKTIIQSFHRSTCPEQRSTIGHYRDLGLLFKRSTLLQPTKERLKFIFSEFHSYGVFLQTLIAGDSRHWKARCEVVPEAAAPSLLPSGSVGPVVQPDGHSVLADAAPEAVALVSQAHLLLTLYGPLLPESTLGWQDLVERGLPHSALWDLARAFLLLFSKLEVKGQNTNSLPWHVENVARLLVLCGSSLCYTILASKAVNGRLLEISRLIVYIILVCEKDGYHMSWAVKMVQNLCKVFSTPPERFGFIQQLENMFSDETKPEDRETFQSLCILLDSSARFHTKFLHMILK